MCQLLVSLEYFECALCNPEVANKPALVISKDFDRHTDNASKETDEPPLKLTKDYLKTNLSLTKQKKIVNRTSKL